MKRFVSFLVVFLVLFVNIPKSFAEIEEDDLFFIIKNYDIKMVVNEDNTFDITEKIDVNFNYPRHGITRIIPLQNTLKRQDGSTSKNFANITNLTVSEKNSQSKNNGMLEIQIGDKDKTIEGDHTYEISYTYDIGADPLKNEDELYFNLIGDKWETFIEKVNFKIIMPKEFDESLIGFSSGALGSADSSNVEYVVNGNEITGNIKDKLGLYQALTIRLSLPEGYFNREKEFNNYCFGTISVAFLCVLISFIIWKKHGKNEKPIETVEFYPPKDLNSADIAFIYRGYAQTKDAISLLLYLADKGYIKIEENGKNPKKSNCFKITKIKEYDGNNECEKTFFDGLFKKTKKDKYGNPFVTAKQLEYNFSSTIDSIVSELNKDENKEKIFDQSAKKKSKWLIFMMLLLYILVIAIPSAQFVDKLNFISSIIFPGIFFYVAYCTFMGSVDVPKSFGIPFGLIIGSILMILHLLPSMENPDYLIMEIIGIVCIFIIVFLIKAMNRRTKYGNEMLGKIKGFKRFLEIARKEELENLVEENPKYFYNILPYTYALGISDVWAKQFEKLAYVAPEWFDSDNVYDSMAFTSFMSQTMKTAKSSMTIVEIDSGSSSSSSSTGGGYSGGGSGGGGGHSW